MLKLKLVALGCRRSCGSIHELESYAFEAWDLRCLWSSTSLLVAIEEVLRASPALRGSKRWTLLERQ